METFAQAFLDALTMIGLGEKRARAIKAHEHVRDVLARDETLKSWDVQTILIGSYGRETAIYPGKDVDVFVKLPGGPDDPAEVFDAVKAPLKAEYKDRLVEHRRSLMITFGDDFSVDAVPAIPSGSRWKIRRPTRTTPARSGRRPTPSASVNSPPSGTRCRRSTVAERMFQQPR